MNAQYMNFWQNPFTDMLDTSQQIRNMDKMVAQSIASFEEITNLFQKLGNWDMFFNPMPSSLFDFRKNVEDYLKSMGFFSSMDTISIDEYRALVNKYEELKKEKHSLEKTRDDQADKIKNLNKSVSNEKKKVATRDKSLQGEKSKAEEMKTVADGLKNDLSEEKKRTKALQQELNEAKKRVETLKKDIETKGKSDKKQPTTKA